MAKTCAIQCLIVTDKQEEEEKTATHNFFRIIFAIVS